MGYNFVPVSKKKFQLPQNLSLKQIPWRYDSTFADILLSPVDSVHRHFVSFYTIRTALYVLQWLFCGLLSSFHIMSYIIQYLIISYIISYYTILYHISSYHIVSVNSLEGCWSVYNVQGNHDVLGHKIMK